MMVPEWLEVQHFPTDVFTGSSAKDTSCQFRQIHILAVESDEKAQAQGSKKLGGGGFWKPIQVQ